MNISIRTRGRNIRSQFRSKLERYLRKALPFDEARITTATLYITATPIAGSYTGFACRLVLRSPRTGKIVVQAEAPRLTVALRQVARRGRLLLRQRRKQRLARNHGSRMKERRPFDRGWQEDPVLAVDA